MLTLEFTESYLDAIRSFMMGLKRAWKFVSIFGLKKLFLRTFQEQECVSGGILEKDGMFSYEGYTIV